MLDKSTFHLHRAIAFVFLLITALLVVSCAGSSAPVTQQPTSAPAAQAKDEWVVATTEEAADLNPQTMSTLGSEMANRNVLEPLADYEGSELKLTPKLAESWDSLPDGKTYVFHLRKGVKFQNGEEFNADAVKFSFDLYSKKESTRFGYLGPLEPKIEITDPYTVKLTLKEPTPLVFVNLNQLSVLPPKEYAKQGDQSFGKTPIGTGPYQLVEWKRNERMVFERYEGYWGPKPKPRRVVFRPITEATTRVAELLSGGVDIAAGIPMEQLKDLQAKSDIAILPVKGARQLVYAFNQSTKPFSDVRVRLALNLAVNRDEILNNILTGYAKPMNGPNFAPGVIGYDSTIPAYPYDPDKAKALLAEAGYPNGFQATWDVSNGAFLKDKEVAEAVTGQLQKIGVKLNMRVTERPKLVSGFMAGDFLEMTSTTWGTIPDPDVWLTWNMINRKSFVDQKAIDMLLASKKAIDPQAREKILKDLNRYLHDNPIWLYVYAPADLYAAKKDIGWAPYALRGDLGYTYYWVPGAGK